MSQIWKPKTTQAALGTSTGAASTVGSSEFVRLFNSADVNTEHLVTLEQTDGTDLGTFTLGGHESVIIKKQQVTNCLQPMQQSSLVVLKFLSREKEITNQYFIWRHKFNNPK